MTHLLWVWGPAAVLMAVIFGLSSISDIPAPPGGLSDVSVHAIVYAALGVLMVRALADARWRGVTARTVVAAVALAIVYGATDEYHQSFVEGRFADARDLLADAVGACTGVCAGKARSRGTRCRDVIFETLFETLWVTNPIRPRSAASRNRVMRGPGVTQGAKRSQGARRPRD